MSHGHLEGFKQRLIGLRLLYYTMHQKDVFENIALESTKYVDNKWRRTKNCSKFWLVIYKNGWPGPTKLQPLRAALLMSVQAVASKPTQFNLTKTVEARCYQCTFISIWVQIICTWLPFTTKNRPRIIIHSLMITENSLLLLKACRIKKKIIF